MKIKLTVKDLENLASTLRGKELLGVPSDVRWGREFPESQI